MIMLRMPMFSRLPFFYVTFVDLQVAAGVLMDAALTPATAVLYHRYVEKFRGFCRDVRSDLSFNSGLVSQWLALLHQQQQEIEVPGDERQVAAILQQPTLSPGENKRPEGEACSHLAQWGAARSERTPASSGLSWPRSATRTQRSPGATTLQWPLERFLPASTL